MLCHYLKNHMSYTLKQIQGEGARILTSFADQKGWLERVPDYFYKKNERYWVIIIDKTMYLYEDAKSNKPKETINLSEAKISYDKNGHFTIKIPTKIGFKKYTFRVPEKFSLEKKTVHQWQKIINETSTENKIKKSAETHVRKLLQERRRGTISEDVCRKITPSVRKAPKPMFPRDLKT